MSKQLQEQVLLIAKPDLSTHILDTSLGKPAAHVRVLVEKQVHQEGMDSATYVKVCEGKTDADGRIKGTAWNVPHQPAKDQNNEIYQFGPMKNPQKRAIYRVTFFTKEYFERMGIEEFLYPFVQIVYYMDEGQHYHVPLLLSPFGYSTYRGS